MQCICSQSYLELVLAIIGIRMYELIIINWIVTRFGSFGIMANSTRISIPLIIFANDVNYIFPQ